MSDERDIAKELRDQYVNRFNFSLYDEAADEIERLRAERDEARRFICDMSWEDKKEVATKLGWDCFKEDGK